MAWCPNLIGGLFPLTPTHLLRRLCRTVVYLLFDDCFLTENASCKRSGVFLQPGTNCKSYYVCVQHGTSWHQFFMSCPRGKKFNTDIAACETPPPGEYVCNN